MLKVYKNGVLVGYITAEDGLTNCQVSVELNGKSTLQFTLPITSSKWDLFSDNVTVQVDGREYVYINANDAERAKTFDGTIRMTESWARLGRYYPTVGSTDYAVTILSGEPGQGGYDAGSAGSALYRLLNAGGTTPTSPTFTRNSTAYNPETGAEVAVNEPRYVEGAFEDAEGAGFVEEGTTNLVANGSFETDSNSDGVADDWTAVLYGVTPSLADDAFAGSKSQQLTSAEGGTPSRVQQSIAIEGGKSYTLSGKLKTDGTVPGRLYFITNGTAVSGNSSDLTPTSWTDVSVSFTAPVDATSVTVRCYNYATDVPGWVRWDAVQLEAKPYATSFTDATRSPELATIPTAGVLSADKGEVAIWRRMDIPSSLPPSGVHRNIFSLGGVVWGIFISNGLADAIRWAVGAWGSPINVPITWDSGDLLFICAEWDLPNATLHVFNHTKGTYAKASIANAVSVVVPASAYVGCPDGTNFNAHCNGAHDDLRISDIARSDAEILAAYQSGEPLPVDEHTTYKLNFDGSLTPEKIGGYGWTVGTVDVSGTHDLETEKQTLLENIYEVQKIWDGGWLVFDSVNHTVSLRDNTLWANDTGFEIRYQKNQKTLKKIEDWEPVVTRLIPFGEKDLDIGSVNGGVKYLENFTYVSEVRERIHRWENITSASELKTAATAYLAKYCKPQIQYESEMVDLRTLSDYSHEELSLGDIVVLQDEDITTNETVRLIGLTYDVVQPWKCKLKLGDPLANAYDFLTETQLSLNARTVGGQKLNKVSRTPATIIVADRTTSRDFRRADYVVPLGATDAQVTIQEAIDDLPATGGKVVLLDGTYKIDDAIYMPSRCALEGQGSSTVIDAQQATIISIKNKLAGDTDISVRNMRVTRSVSTAFQLMGVRDSIVEGVWMEDSYVGIALHDCSGVAIKNNVVRNMSYWGISVVGITEKIQVTGNLIYNCLIGINAFSSEASAHWHQFSGNTIRESTLYGIELFNSSRNTVSNNVISRSGSAGIYAHQSSHNRITGNLVEDSSLSSDLIHPGIKLEFTADYNSIEENVIRMVDSVSHEGTAVSGTSNTIKLSAAASTTDDAYNNRRIGITSGTGSGQDKKITDYVGSTQTATVDTNWATVPDATSVYKIYARPSYGIGIGMMLTTPAGNLVTNNDLYNSGITGSLYDHGVGTITAAGNRL